MAGCVEERLPSSRPSVGYGHVADIDEVQFGTRGDWQALRELVDDRNLGLAVATAQRVDRQRWLLRCAMTCPDAVYGHRRFTDMLGERFHRAMSRLQIIAPDGASSAMPRG